MKYTKKLLSLVLVLVLALALAVPGFAAPLDNVKGSVEVTNPTAGSTYNIYKIFDVTYISDEEGDATSPTNGYAYTIDTTPNTDGARWYDQLNGKGVFNFEETVQENIYNVTVATGKTEAEVGAALKSALDALESTVSVAKSAIEAVEGAEVKWTDLELGYYMVTSTTEGSVGSTVALTTTSKDAKIIEKNDNPGWDDEGGKTVLTADGSYAKLTSATYGDTLTFRLRINAKDYDGYDPITEYVVYDQLPEGMTFVRITSVTVGGETFTATTGAAAPSYTDKTYKLGNAGTDGSDPYSFNVTIPWGAAENGKDRIIEILYTAKVTSTMGVDENKQNKAWFDFNQEPGGDSTVDVYTYDIEIHKVNGSDESKPLLAGATFELKDSTGTTIKLVGSGNSYRVATMNEEGAVEGGAVAQFTTTNTGNIVISGLAAGEYILTEIEAPEGYNILVGDVTIKIEQGQNGAYTVKYTYNNEETNAGQGTTGTDNDQITVENNQGTVLPGTGGMGTTIFYTLGGVLVVGAAILLVTKKRVHDVEG